MSYPWPTWTEEEWREEVATMRKERGRKDLYGTSTSGNYGHSGRPGEIGGSGPTSESASDRASREADIDAALQATAPNVGGRLAPSSFDVRTKPDGGELTIRQGKLAAREFGSAKAAVFPEHNIADVATQVLVGIPGDLDVKFTSTAIGQPQGAGSHNAVVMTASRDDGLTITRTFIRNKDGTLNVTHDKFEIPESEQGKGTATKVLGDSYDLYQKLGVRRITTMANLAVGGYTWARFGFKAAEPSTLARSLEWKLTEPSNPVPGLPPPAIFNEGQRRDLLALVHKYRNDPELPWHVAGVVDGDGRKIGKDLLVGSSWLGELDLRDKGAVRRLTHYTKGKQKAKGK